MVTVKPSSKYNAWKTNPIMGLMKPTKFKNKDFKSRNIITCIGNLEIKIGFIGNILY